MELEEESGPGKRFGRGRNSADGVAVGRVLVVTLGESAEDCLTLSPLGCAVVGSGLSPDAVPSSGMEREAV